MEYSDLRSSCLLSIVIPVFNGEVFLEGCLNSVMRSVESLAIFDRELVEVIVCDNCSNDKTLIIAKSFVLNCSYKVIQTPQHFPNRTKSWSHGLSAASGTWMMMLHADDKLKESGFSDLITKCKTLSNSSVVLISGKIQTFTDSTLPKGSRPRWPFTSLIRGSTLRKNIFPYFCPIVPFVVMRRSAYFSSGCLNEDYELTQDWELWIRILDLGDFYFFPKVFGLWRVHGFTVSYSEKMAIDVLKLAFKSKSLQPLLSEREVNKIFYYNLVRARNLLSEAKFRSVLESFNINKAIYGSLENLEAAKRRILIHRIKIGLKLYIYRMVGTLRLIRYTFYNSK